MSILKVKNLFKSYGKIEVLKNFSLDIDSTEFVSLLGPSGCGKTLFLKLFLVLFHQIKELYLLKI
jgi:ABC-type sugar transport system ATPase subunit